MSTVFAGRQAGARLAVESGLLLVVSQSPFLSAASLAVTVARERTQSPSCPDSCHTIALPDGRNKV
jgi:hypothetical protein